LDVVNSTVQALWTTYAGGPSTIATQASSGVGTYRTGNGPLNLFDGDLNTRYSSRGNSTSSVNAYAGLNTGLYLTIVEPNPVLTGFLVGNDYDDDEREPLLCTVEGSNCPVLATCTNWILLYNGTTGLDALSNNLTYGDFITISNSASYQSYRFLVTAKRDLSSSVEYSELVLYGYY
jgi:hypothetical protein